MKHSRQPLWNRAGIFVLVSLCAGIATVPLAQAKANKDSRSDGPLGPGDTATVQVEVDSPSDAEQASVMVNGKTIGPVPLTLSLQPGRYLIEVSKPGRQIWRKWLDVAAGDKAVLRASLLPATGSADEPEREGTLLVACDVLSATVFVDGTLAGTVPALVKGLKPGKHLVEVRAEGRRSRADATVRAGKTTKLSLSLGRAAAAPSSSEEPSDSAEGTPAEEPAPAPGDPTRTPPGPGGAPTAANASTEASATLRVDTEPRGAEVLVDGVVRGVAPLSIEGLAPGAHEVEVRSDGMSSVAKTVVLEPGASPQLTLRLEREPSASPSDPMAVLRSRAPAPGGKMGELVVRSAKPGAIVYVNGERLGETPLRRRLLVGPHVVSVRRAGYENFLAMAEVRAATPASLDVVLKPRHSSDGGGGRPGGAGSRAEGGGAELSATYVSMGSLDARPADVGLMGTYSARLVRPTYVMADFSTGFPYLAEIRLTAGIADFGSFGVDGGVDLRTYGAMTEVGLRGRLRLLSEGPWALATSFSLGGGGGPKGRSTFYVETAAVASAAIANWMSVSLRSALSVYSDRHCPASPNPNELDVCRQSLADGSNDDPRGRFAGLRLIFGAIAELPLADWINVFGALEVAPFQGNRKAFSDQFASIMPESDPGLYGRIGITIKR